MPINFTKYIDIISGVGAGAAVPARELIGRLFTSSNLLPPGTLIEFDNADDAGTYFGTDSVEYARAVFNFSWISKSITRAQKIGFARWVETAVAPRVYGVVGSYLLSNFTGVSAGSIGVTMGTFTHQFTAIDLSAATSLADVASAVQTAIRTYSAGGTLFTGATVTYDATRQSFNLVGGTTGPAAMDIEVGGTGVDIASKLGWLAGAIMADGAAVETVTETLIASAQASDNFGSFLFIDTLSADEVVEAATWNASQNLKFIYCVPVSAADASTYSAALLAFAGTALTLSPLASEYPEMVPMVVLAATRYDRQNSVQNYMFQRDFPLTAAVSTTALSDTYDGLRVNYYGVTQTAGALLAFYQRGTLMGGSTAPTDQNTYANEMWLKDYVGSQLMALLLALPRISANEQGKSQVATVIQTAVNQGLFNGTISVGKPLTTQQKLYIGELTGDDLAWHQVQDIGYWFDVVIESVATQDQRTEWKAVYTLIYSKDDAIRKIDGTHVLI